MIGMDKIIGAIFDAHCNGELDFEPYFDSPIVEKDMDIIATTLHTQEGYETLMELIYEAEKCAYIAGFKTCMELLPAAIERRRRNE